MSKKQRYRIMDLTGKKNGYVWVKPHTAYLLKLNTEQFGHTTVVHGFDMYMHEFYDERQAGVVAMYNLQKAQRDLKQLAPILDRDTRQFMKDMIMIAEEKNQMCLQHVDYNECM